MLERIMEEVKLLQKQYGGVEIEPNGKWISFKKFELPEGWNKEIIELLIIIPPGYPSTPPDNFFVPIGFRLKNGQQPSQYTEPHSHFGKEWGQFSYHIDGEWKPSKDILDGANLQTFMLKVLDRLKELN